jgi:hypothetical protein
MQVLRALVRAYAPAEQLDAFVAFYEQLFGERCKLRMPLPALGLEIAMVGSTHLVAGSEKKLRPFRIAQATFFVATLMDAESELKRLGAEILFAPERGPGGSFMIAKFPDGLIVEFIEQTGDKGAR